MKSFISKFLLATMLITSVLTTMPVASALSMFEVNSQGLMNGNFPGAPVKATSNAVAAVKVSVTNSTGGNTLTSVQANFSGEGFTKGDLATIAVDDTSGVAIYGDNGTTPGSFDGGDTVVTLAASPNWVPESTNIILTLATPVPLGTVGSNIFYVVFKTSGTITSGDKIDLTIPVNGVVTSDGSGPSTAFEANDFTADTVAPTISSVTGFPGAGATTVSVKFSEPVQKAAFGNLTFVGAGDPLTFVDNGTTSTHTISSITHTAGHDIATVTLSGDLDSGDFDGSPSTMAAGSGKIADFAGNVIDTSTKSFSSPLTITTNVVPTTYVGQVTDSSTPLVTFAANGGVSAYSFTANAAGDSQLLTDLGLSLATNGKLTGTTANLTGSYNLNVKVTDSTDGAPKTATKFFTINVAATNGGSVPGISSINPPGGPQSATTHSITVTGSGTTFTSGSTVAITMPPGQAGTNGIGSAGGDGSSGNPTVVFNSATSLTVSFSIKSTAALGARDVKVTTGTQVVTMPNGFGIFAAGGSGLTPQFPPSAGTNIQIPPGFNFSPSTNSSLASYRITLKSTSDFSGTALWDYVFPKQTSSAPSLCNDTNCNLIYGNGQFRTITQPAPLSPNTTYFWQVKTYSLAPDSVSDSTTPLEQTPVNGFTTVTSITDTVAPTIMHRPVFEATASTNLVVFARINDNVATNATTPILGTSIFYCAGSGCSPTTEASGTYVGSGYYKFTIPNTTIGVAGTIVRYYLKATDGTNIKNFKQPDGTTPFQLTSVTAGSSTIAGTVKDSTTTCASGVQSATIFAEGTGFSTTSSGDSNCTFTITGMLSGIYDLIAVKDGYADRLISGIAGGSTGIGFKLPAGSAGGFGGDTAKPQIKFNGPMDGMTGIPGNDSNFKVFVAFNKAMSQTSVTAVNNMQVNEINPSTGALTDITSTKGSWTYYATAPTTPGIPSEANMAVWSLFGGSTFGDGKTIAVIVKPEVSDTAGNGIQGNQPDGSYAFSFTTGSSANFAGFNSTTGGFSGGGTFGQGAFVPPHIEGTTPPPGAFDVPRNTKLLINFSEAMADDASDCTTGYCLKNNVKLFLVTGTTGTTETDVTSTAINTVSLDTTKKVATITLKSGYNSGTFDSSAKYRLKVLGSAKSATGMTLAPPDQATAISFMSEFKTSATSDTAAPSITGSFPDTAATGVPVNMGSMHVSFNKDLNPSTITTSTFYLSTGSSAVTGTVEYMPLEREAIFTPKNALSANTAYTLNLTADIQGLNGVAITATTKTFTTGSADTGAPGISFINVDDYGIAITFTEPMNAAKALDTLNWDASVINPATYNVIRYGTAAFNPGSAGTDVGLTTATFTYEPASNTVLIEGLDLKTAIGQELYISMDITGTPGSGAKVAKDLSGNLITSAGNTARAPIQSSANTGGALGPMASSSFDAGGGFVPSNFSSTTFGFAPPIEVRPFNMTAGKTTVYGVRLPISKQIPISGTVVLTFPSGFDVSGAKQDVNSPMKKDLNGPGTGTVTFKCTTATGGTSCGGAATVTGDTSGGGDSATRGGLADDGVVVNTSARSITVNLSAATSSNGNDFLNIDLDGIKNSTVPKDFNTTGYTVDVKTKDGSTVLESQTSAPIFIQSAGSYTLSGTVTATGNDQAGTAKVYLMSPMTGPAEAITADFASGATASYSFTGLTAGDYMLFTDQSVTLGSKEFIGMSIPQRVVISEATDVASDTVDNDVIDKDFTLANTATGGTTVTINIDGPNAEPLDIFVSSPTGFKTKQVTLDSSAGAEAFTMKVANGTWQIGVGPQMPKGFAGAPPAPTYLPPQPRELKVADPACAVNGTVGCSTTFTLTTSDKTIKGIVKDGSGKIMANAEVYAYSPNGGFGTHAEADASGNFTLNVVAGSYVVGAFVPGMPPSKEVPVAVTSAEVTYLLIDSSTTAVSAATAATTFILKVAKPDYTISGKVTDGTNVIQGASVFAYRTDGPGHANANTDSSGNYTLYVSAGTWKVGAFLPQYGNLAEQTVVITTASATSQNFAPSGTGTFRSVSGTVTSGGSAVQGAFVRISGTNVFNETSTGSDGTYSFKVPEGTGYKISAFIPGVGETPSLATFTVSGSDVTDKDITVATPRTITVTLSATVTEAFVEVANSTGMRSGVQIKNGTTGTLYVPDGSYAVKVWMPGTSINVLTGVTATTGDTVYSSTTGLLTVNGNEGITVTLPTLRTVTGTVKDASDVLLADAWVEITNQTAGVHFGAKTDSNGAFSLSAADGTYKINAMKPGYFSTPSSLVVNGSTAAQALVLTTASTTIAGQVKVGSSGVASAFVRAERQGGGFSGTQADTSGNFTLAVTSGVWKICAVGNGYAEACATDSVDVTGGSVTGKNITLSTTVTVDSPFSKPITPATGGTLEDIDAGITLTMPAGVLGSESTDAASIAAAPTSNVTETSSAKPVAGQGLEITATDAEGSPIKTLSGDVTIDMELTVAELAATDSSTDSSINTLAEVETIKLAYWDESTAAWVTQSTTLTYLDSSGNPLTDSTAYDTASEFAAVVSKVLVSGTTDHFSLFAPVVSTDPAAPDAPSGFAATAASTTQINLSWTLLAGATQGYDIYRSTTSGGTYSRLGSEPTVAATATVTYSDTNLSAGTTYYYKISALNNSGESAASAAVSATTTAAAAASPSAGGGLTTSPGSSSSGGANSSDEDDEDAEVADDAAAEAEVEVDGVSETMPFVDSVGHWAEGYIEDLFTNQIVGGKDSTHFAPNDNVSRAEFTKMIVNGFKLDMPDVILTTSSFKDVKVMDWFVSYVEVAMEAGLVGGYKDGTFKPNSSINRAEAVKILLEAAEAQWESAALSDFTDVKEGAWYAKYVGYAVANGIVGGYADGTFGPDKNITRAESAKIISLILGL